MKFYKNSFVDKDEFNFEYYYHILFSELQRFFEKYLQNMVFGIFSDFNAEKTALLFSVVRYSIRALVVSLRCSFSYKVDCCLATEHI